MWNFKYGHEGEISSGNHKMMIATAFFTWNVNETSVNRLTLILYLI